MLLLPVTRWGVGSSWLLVWLYSWLTDGQVTWAKLFLILLLKTSHSLPLLIKLWLKLLILAYKALTMQYAHTYVPLCTRQGARTRRDGRVGHKAIQARLCCQRVDWRKAPIHSGRADRSCWPSIQCSNWHRSLSRCSYCYCHSYTRLCTHTHMDVSFTWTEPYPWCTLNNQMATTASAQ